MCGVRAAGRVRRILCVLVAPTKPRDPSGTGEQRHNPVTRHGSCGQSLLPRFTRRTSSSRSDAQKGELAAHFGARAEHDLRYPGPKGLKFRSPILVSLALAISSQEFIKDMEIPNRVENP